MKLSWDELSDLLWFINKEIDTSASILDTLEHEGDNISEDFYNLEGLRCKRLMKIKTILTSLQDGEEIIIDG